MLQLMGLLAWLGTLNVFTPDQSIDSSISCYSSGEELIIEIRDYKLRKDRVIKALNIAKLRHNSGLDILPGYPSCPSLDAIDDMSAADRSVIIPENDLGNREYIKIMWVITLIEDGAMNLRDPMFYDGAVMQANQNLLKADRDIRKLIIELSDR